MSSQCWHHSCNSCTRALTVWKLLDVKIMLERVLEKYSVSKSMQLFPSKKTLNTGCESRLWKKNGSKVYGAVKLCANQRKHKILHPREGCSENAVSSPVCWLLPVTGMRHSEMEGQPFLSWEAPYPPPQLQIPGLRGDSYFSTQRNTVFFQ